MDPIPLDQLVDVRTGVQQPFPVAGLDSGNTISLAAVATGRRRGMWRHHLRCSPSDDERGDRANRYRIALDRRKALKLTRPCSASPSVDRIG
jgi:hypothetical protein